MLQKMVTEAVIHDFYGLQKTGRGENHLRLRLSDRQRLRLGLYEHEHRT